MHNEILEIMSIRDIERYRAVIRDDILSLVPEMKPAVGFDGGPHHDETVFEHLLWASEEVSPKYPLIRFSALLHDIGKPHTWNGEHFRHHAQKGAEMAEKIMDRLGGFDKAEQAFVKKLIASHMMKPLTQLNDNTIVSKIRDMEAFGVSWRDFLRLRLADRHGTGNWRNRRAVSPNLPYARDMIRRIREAQSNFEAKSRQKSHNPLAVSGRDVMRTMEIPEGPKVGKILKFLYDNYPHDNRDELLNGIMKIKNSYFPN